MILYICDICGEQDINYRAEERISVYMGKTLVTETQPKMRCHKCRAITFDRARKFISGLEEG
jgi:hypothetical protein